MMEYMMLEEGAVLSMKCCKKNPFISEITKDLRKFYEQGLQISESHANWALLLNTEFYGVIIVLFLSNCSTRKLSSLASSAKEFKLQ